MSRYFQRYQSIAFIIVIFASMLAAPLTVQAAPTMAVIDPVEMEQWFFSNDGVAGVSSGTLVSGPATPPLGTGSARLQIDSTARMLVGTIEYAGTPVADLTSLSYAAYQPAFGLNLQFDVDYDGTDSDVTYQGRLVFEAVYSGIALQPDTWQTWDTLATTPSGSWWSSRAPGNVVCPQSNPCDMTEVLAAFPDAVISGALMVKAGGPIAGGFTGYTDAITVGINGVEDTFDLEQAFNTYVDAAIPTYPGVNGLYHFATIQGGVNAVVSGGTVNVAAGTYVEQVTIRRSLNIVGADQAAVMVQAPEYALRNQEVRTFGFGNRTIDYVIGAFDAGTVHVSNLTIDGLNRGASTCISGVRGAGMAFIDTDGSLQNAGVLNAAQPLSAFGCQDGAWQAVLGANAISKGTRSVTVRDVTIAGFQKNGITAWTDAIGGMLATIEDNTITTAPTNLTAQNGIQVSGGASGIIRGNTLSGVYYTGLNWSASGILLYNAHTATVENNVLNGCQTSIYGQDTALTVNGNRINANSVATAQLGYWGISVVDPPFAAPSPSEKVAVIKTTAFQQNITPLAGAPIPMVVTNNVIVGDGTENAFAGIEAYEGYGTLDVSIIATGNTITGWENGIYFGSCTSGCTTSKITSADFNHNRVVNNTVGLKNDTSLSIEAVENWWGCNEGPGQTGCDSVEGTAVADPWLVLSLASNPNPIMSGQSAFLTGGLAKNSDGETATNNLLPANIPMALFAQPAEAAYSFVSQIFGLMTGQVTAPILIDGSTGTATIELDNETVEIVLYFQPFNLFLPIISR